jgi:hypothetical protein
MTFPRALLIIVVSAVPHVAPASAEPPLQDVGALSSDFSAGGSQVIADRTRVAYMPEAGRVRVIDERLTEVATVVEHDCAWRSFGGGALLWACPTVASASGVAGEAGGLPDRSTRRRAATGARPACRFARWARRGAQLVGGRPAVDDDLLRQLPRYPQLRQPCHGEGRLLHVESINAARHVRLITDLDQDDLTRRVCAQLAPRLVGEWPTRIAPLVYRAPYGATLIGTRFLMARCGARTLSVLSRCLRSCSAPVIGDRFVAWTEGTSLTHRTVYARLADRGRTWRWRVQAPPSRHPVAAVGRRLFIAGQGILQTVQLPEVVR